MDPAGLELRWRHGVCQVNQCVAHNRGHVRISGPDLSGAVLVEADHGGPVLLADEFAGPAVQKDREHGVEDVAMRGAAGRGGEQLAAFDHSRGGFEQAGDEPTVVIPAKRW